MTADTGSGAASTRDAGLRRIETLLQQGRVEAALAEQEEFLRTHANDLGLPNMVGELYLQVGLVDRAVPLFFRSGNACLAEGFAARAAAYYRKVLKFAPDHEETLIRLARAYASQGLLADTRACLDKVVSARQGRGDTAGLNDALGLLHSIEVHASPHPGAEEAAGQETGGVDPEFVVEKGTGVEPMYAEILPERDGSVVVEVAGLETETDLLALLSELEDEIDLTSMLDDGPAARETVAGGSLDEAFAGLRSAPRTAAEQLALARTLIGAGLVEHALGPLTAAAADPTNGYEAATELARIAQDTGNREQMAVWLERAAQLPASPAKRGAALYRLGLVLEGSGSFARALAAFEELAAFAPDFRDVAERLTRLRGRTGGGPSIR